MVKIMCHKSLSYKKVYFYEDCIEKAKRVKISAGSRKVIIIIENKISRGLFLDLKNGSIQEYIYSKQLAHDMIDALGGVEDIGGEKLLATITLYDFKEIAQNIKKQKKGGDDDEE